MKRFFNVFKTDYIRLNIFAINLPINVYLIILISVIFSSVAYIIFLAYNLVVAYNDARAHMDMARLVFDNLKPGLAQIGSVWLPLDHLLKLVFVWDDSLWQSGFAGSIWSMISYVLTSLLIYLLVSKVTHDKIASLLGTLVFITNINVLYMQSTPMTELLLLFFFTATTYFLYLWSGTKKIEYLIVAAFWVFLATLTRYDGWFLFATASLFVVAVTVREFFEDKETKHKTVIRKYWSLLESRIILFCLAGGLGIFLWFGWNLLIFGDPLYFATGPYSAKSQQDRIDASGALFSKHDLPLSILAYWYAMVDNVGLLLMLFAVTGLVVFIFRKRLKDSALAIYTLLSPFFFHVISLFVGFSILVVPEIGPELTKQANSSWFNVRYGLMILPAVAFFSGYLTRKSILLKTILFALIVLEFFLFYSKKNVITITDGVIGTSSLDVGDVRDWLVFNVRDKKGLILTSISYNNALAFSTGMHLKRFIHEGTGKYWSDSLKDPTTHAQWIVMANGDVGDPVYTALITKEKSNFLHFYDLKMKGKHTNIYERKEVEQGLVWKDGNELRIGDEAFRFVGVNSYDLAYRSADEIDETLRTAKENGIKVIRFWAFGDGIEHGFQPSPDEYNKAMIDNLALIVRDAEKYNLKLIITMSNYWGDYGGVPQYLKWANLPNKSPKDFDLFFTSSETKNIYKDYVREIVTAIDPVTNKAINRSPAILSWELMNEPRSSRIETSKVVADWANEMSKYILSLDNIHIVSLGSEGFSGLYNDGKNGPLISNVGSLDSINMLTAHYYLSKDERDLPAILHDWTKQSKINYKKPLILEEVGFDKNPKKNNNRTREELVSELFDYAKKEGVNGIVFWNWALKIDESFGISPNDPKDSQLLKIIRSYSDSLPK